MATNGLRFFPPSSRPFFLMFPALFSPLLTPRFFSFILLSSCFSFNLLLPFHLFPFLLIFLPPIVCFPFQLVMLRFDCSCGECSAYNSGEMGIPFLASVSGRGVESFREAALKRVIGELRRDLGTSRKMNPVRVTGSNKVCWSHSSSLEWSLNRWPCLRF